LIKSFETLKVAVDLLYLDWNFTIKRVP